MNTEHQVALEPEVIPVDSEPVPPTEEMQEFSMIETTKAKKQHLAFCRRNCGELRSHEQHMNKVLSFLLNSVTTLATCV